MEQLIEQVVMKKKTANALCILIKASFMDKPAKT